MIEGFLVRHAPRMPLRDSFIAWTSPFAISATVGRPPSNAEHVVDAPVPAQRVLRHLGARGLNRIDHITQLFEAARRQLHDQHAG